MLIANMLQQHSIK